jgi:hypothetical protein
MDEDVDNEEKFGGWAHVCACVKSLEGNPGQIVQILHNSSGKRTLRVVDGLEHAVSSGCFTGHPQPKLVLRFF